MFFLIIEMFFKFTSMFFKINLMIVSKLAEVKNAAFCCRRLLLKWNCFYLSFNPSAFGEYV